MNLCFVNLSLNRKVRDNLKSNSRPQSETFWTGYKLVRGTGARFPVRYRSDVIIVLLNVLIIDKSSLQILILSH